MPVNQVNSAFGKRNERLSGPHVETGDVLRVIRKEFLHRLPLASAPYPVYREKPPARTGPMPKSDSPSARVTGRWRSGRPAPAGVIVIYAVGKSLYLEWRFKDGSPFRKELVDKPDPRGTRYEYKEKGSAGDYYLLPRGSESLVIGDRDGVIQTCARVK